MNSTRTLLSAILLIVSLSQAVWAAPWAGSGIEGDPFLITDATDLLAMTANTSYYGAWFELTGNIDLSQAGTFSTALIAPDPPTTNSNTYFNGLSFTGHFNGNGHTITGLSITGGNNDFLGLFGMIGIGGVVENIGIEGCNISGDYSVGGLAGISYGSVSNCSANGNAAGVWYIGGLMGYNYNGSVTNCSASGHVTGRDAGGLVGRNYSGSLSGCSASVTVEGTNDVGGLVGSNSNSVSNCISSGTVTGERYVGGLVGNNFSGSLSGCSASGAVTGTGLDVGGLVGYNYNGSVSNCNAGGDVSGTAHVGGLVGYIVSGDVSNCTASGAIEGTRYVGGLAGWKENGDVSNCTASGAVTGTSYNVGGLVGHNEADSVLNCSASGDVTGDYDVGGLVGCNYTGNVSGCSASGAITGISSTVGGLVGDNPLGSVLNSSASGAVEGTNMVGGLVGGNGGSVSNCFASGRVTGGKAGGLVGYNASNGSVLHCSADGTVTGTDYIGGLVGRNSGHVSNCAASGTVTGTDLVGGLVGYNGYSSASVSNCYASGAVKGTSSVGGLVGYNSDGMISSCFWDVETSDQLTSAGGTGKATTQMQMQSTFTDAGWDFVGETVNGTADTWTMRCEGMSYPKLAWQPAPAADWVCPEGVGMEDLAFLAARWLDSGCGASGDCDGADLDASGTVDLADFAELSAGWTARGNVADHVFEIEMSLSYDFGEGYGSSVPVEYQFDAWMRVDSAVVSGTVRTPSGTVYPATLEEDDDERWLGVYRASASLGDLADFTDGTYVFTVIYTDGTSDLTSVAFALPDGSPIPPVDQRLVATYPAHHATDVPLTTHVLLTPLSNPDWTYGIYWEPVDDDSQPGGEIDGLPYTTTSAGPLNLGPATLYEIELTVSHAVRSTNDDGIPYVVDKDSEVEIIFTTISAP